MSGKSVNWTEEQLQVIESRGKNLLVSAAAGSGKTAVLVERIIRMVTEGDHPLDIDKLLVMTFTNAAAAEMRERIGAAIEERLMQDPDNGHLQIQAALVHHAHITTIDSFCLEVIRSHFNVLDLDPSFRIGDEGELMLLKNDVMRDMVEDYYADGGDRFLRFVESYAQGKSDAGIEDYIMQVYTFSQSNPYPEQWIARCRKELDGAGMEQMEESPWMGFLMEDACRQAKELAGQLEEACGECREDEYLSAYLPMLTEDVRRLRQVAGARDFKELWELLTGFTWDRLASVRSKEVDQDRKAYVTACRDRAKKAVGKLKDLYCLAEPEEMAHDMAQAGEPVKMLLDLADEFTRRYREKKRERNLVDFDDMEHEALRVLIRQEGGRTVCTPAADELSAQYEEVLVDEYQDSNLVQEALLHAVSRERFGRHNVFMVGDVKQSIYKFRLARPELFLEKYETYEPYGQGDSCDKKIELHQNFRSRAQVLDAVNDMFYRIMTENLGGIHYTEETALHPGAVFAPREGEPPVPELLTVDTGDGVLSQMEEDAADFTAREVEAKLIAAKIFELTDPVSGMQVWDKKLGAYRAAGYRDIVILLRSAAGWTETLLAVLMNEGIPAYAESRTGYFTTPEVETVLSLLAVIDNPMQDIPLAAVLKSPVVGLTDADLARMMARYRAGAVKGQDRGIYAAMKAAADGASADGASADGASADGASADGASADGTQADDAAWRECCAKVHKFLGLLERFRRESTYLPIHELIYRVYERTGYYGYVSAMPAGQTRRANLDMLVEKASSYEQTSYKGLFHFIRYIENLKEYHTDFGEASTLGEEDDTVRIMSIHKSKGLEFPIVILAGMGKKFNRQDVYGRLLIDPELGVGTDYLDLEHRLKATTLKKNVLRRKMELDNLGEELRVLYVAMTRAKEYLAMTGTDRYLARSLEKFAHVPLTEGQIPYTVLAGAGSYLDWLLMGLGAAPARITVTQVPLADIISRETVLQAGKHQSRERLRALDLTAVYDGDYAESLDRCLNFRYAYEADTKLYAAMSVSELKQMGQMEDDAVSFWTEQKREKPAGRRKGAAGDGKEAAAAGVAWDGKESAAAGIPGDGGKGALRGTAYHRAMELLPFHEMRSLADVQDTLGRLVEEKRYPQSYYELVEPETIWIFLQSEFGTRMCRAQAEGRLHKEQQFIMGVPAREIDGLKETGSEELILIQGIIDAYFEEEDGLVLMDYKTDRVTAPEPLRDHYLRQLDYYERALVQMTGKTVKEKVIYSLTLQQAIGCPLSRECGDIG